jgi:hypothetical protein
MSTGLAALTLIHVLISLIGIVSGLVVTYGLLCSQRRDGSTALFLNHHGSPAFRDSSSHFTSCCPRTSSAPFRW